jgi:hypothetical protein
VACSAKSTVERAAQQPEAPPRPDWQRHWQRRQQCCGCISFAACIGWSSRHGCLPPSAPTYRRHGRWCWVWQHTHRLRVSCCFFVTKWRWEQQWPICAARWRPWVLASHRGELRFELWFEFEVCAGNPETSHNVHIFLQLREDTSTPGTFTVFAFTAPRKLHVFRLSVDRTLYVNRRVREADDAPLARK